MKTRISRSDFAWLAGLFAINLAYIVYEFAFNARLTDASVSDISAVSEGGLLHALELEGRTLSGIGLSLIALRFLFRFHQKALARLASAVALVAICFPLMFFGQKAVVDHFVARTNAEQRLDAKLLLLLREGLATGSLQLAQMPIDPAEMDSASTKSLLSILGMMTFASEDFIAKIKSQSDAIIDHVAEQEALKALPESYEFYARFEQATAANWNSYQDAAATYANELTGLNVAADTKWSEIQEQVLSAWTTKLNEMNSRIDARALEGTRKGLQAFFDRTSDCLQNENKSCSEAVLDRYAKEVETFAGRHVDPLYWCSDPTMVQEQKTLGGRLITVRKEIRDCSDLKYEVIRDKVAALLGVQDYDSFISQPEIVATVRNEISKEGLELPEGWTLSDHETFRAAFISSGKERLDVEFAAQMEAATGMRLPPDLDTQRFVALDPIQTPIRNAFGLSPERIVAVGMTSDAFLESVIKPIYVDFGEQKRDALNAEVGQHADGAPLEDEGKSAVRALVVPGIAMSFSLVFAVLNGIALIVTCLRPIAPRPTLMVVQGVLLTAAIAIPLMRATLTKTETYAYLKGEFASELGGVTGTFATWVINAEPMIYRVGKPLSHVAPPLFSASEGEDAPLSQQPQKG